MEHYLPSWPRYVISVEHFSITIAAGATTNTATISRVNTALSFLTFGGFTSQAAGTDLSREAFAYAQLTDATTVTATRNTADANDTVTVKGCVVQCSPQLVASIQTGTISMTTLETSQTATINAVDTGRSVVIYNGCISNAGNDNIDATVQRLTLTNPTTVTGARHIAAAATAAVAFTVVEFQPSIVTRLQQFAQTLTSATASDTLAISPNVDPERSLLFFGGFSTSNNPYDDGFYKAALTNGSTVTLSRDPAGNATGTRTINGTVVEFAHGVLRRVTRGTTDLSGVTSNTTTIPLVDKAMTLHHYCGFSCDIASAGPLGQGCTAAALTDYSTVTATRDGAGTAIGTVGWEAAWFN